MIISNKKPKAMKCKENCTFSLITYTAKIVAKILRRIEKIIEDIFEEDQFQIGRAICVTFHNVLLIDGNG